MKQNIAFSGDDRLKLLGALTFETVVEIWQQSLTLLRAYQAKRLILDLEDVTHCDSSGLALLIDCVRFCKHAHIKLSVTHMPTQMCAIARVSDLDPLIPSKN